MQQWPLLASCFTTVQHSCFFISDSVSASVLQKKKIIIMLNDDAKWTNMSSFLVWRWWKGIWGFLMGLWGKKGKGSTGIDCVATIFLSAFQHHWRRAEKERGYFQCSDRAMVFLILSVSFDSCLLCLSLSSCLAHLPLSLSLFFPFDCVSQNDCSALTSSPFLNVCFFFSQPQPSVPFYVEHITISPLSHLKDSPLSAESVLKAQLAKM